MTLKVSPKRFVHLLHPHTHGMPWLFPFNPKMNVIQDSFLLLSPRRTTLYPCSVRDERERVRVALSSTRKGMARLTSEKGRGDSDEAP